MAILKKIHKNNSGLYEATVDLGDREIRMIQIIEPPRFRIPSYTPIYDTSKQKSD